jgi:uncharacterized integral membrane protein (TIGR00697 family)
MTLRVTARDSEWSPKYFAVVVGLFCGLYVTTNALNAKFIDIAGIILPVGILTFPICAIITDLLTEVYGFNRARQAIWTVLACTVLHALFATIGMHLQPAAFWHHQDAYEIMFATSWRIALAGCCAWIAGEFLNSFVVSRMKIMQGPNSMGVRFIGSTVVGQFADTLIFASIAFSGTMPWRDFGILILSVWGVKIAYEILALPLSLPITRWLKRREGVEHFDRQHISVV